MKKITLNSFQYFGPYICEPSPRFFESMLRCNTPDGELISKNLIVTENGKFDPRPFPLLRQERLDLAQNFIQAFESSLASEARIYYMVDAFVTLEDENEVKTLMETDCVERVLSLMLLTEETRLALQYLGPLTMVYCVVHLYERNAEGKLYPPHLHMAFQPKELPSKQMIQTIGEIVKTDLTEGPDRP